MKKTNPFIEHQRAAVRARWAKTTPEERSDHAKGLVAAREAKRALKRQASSASTFPESEQDASAAADQPSNPA